MLSINELLSFFNFKQIITVAIEAISTEEIANVYALIASTSQPEQWIEQRLSDFADENGQPQYYSFNRIQLLEAVMDKLFYWSTEVISVTTHQDKAKFAVTAHVGIKFNLKNTPFPAPVKVADGVATVYSPTIQYLTLATPKAVTEAKKNAMKSIGKLFGSDLNRDLEDNREIGREAFERLMATALEEISNATTSEELRNLHDVKYVTLISNRDFITALLQQQSLINLKKQIKNEEGA